MYTLGFCIFIYNQCVYATILPDDLFIILVTTKIKHDAVSSGILND